MKLKKCEKCKKTVQVTNYERHFIYCGAKEFKCTMCEKKYRHLPSLYKHERIHEVAAHLVNDKAPTAETSVNVSNEEATVQDILRKVKTINCFKCGRIISKTKSEKHTMCCCGKKMKDSAPTSISPIQDSLPISLSPIHDSLPNNPPTAKTIPTINCTKCGDTIQKKNFERHYMYCSASKLKCTMCKKVFNSISSLSRHEQKHRALIVSAGESGSNANLSRNVHSFSIKVDSTTDNEENIPLPDWNENVNVLTAEVDAQMLEPIVQIFEEDREGSQICVIS